MKCGVGWKTAVSTAGRLLLIALSGLSSGLAIAQSPTPARALPGYRYRLLGVYDVESGAPVEGAEILDMVGRVTARTTVTGTVTLVFLPEGGSLIRIRKIGYEPTTFFAKISAADTVPLTLVLRPVAHMLAAVISLDSTPRYLSANLQGFEERRKSNVGGHFITESEMRKHDTEKVTGLIRTLPGLAVLCSRTGVHSCGASSTRQSVRCPPVMYVDGSVFTQTDLEQLAVNQFAAIEFYAGGASAPPQYNMTGSSCGVLLFWTRER